MSPVDFEALKKRKEGRSARGWKPDPGENPIRVLPPSKEYVEEEYGGEGRPVDRVGLEFQSHFVRVDKDLHVFRCLRDLDEPCPACNFFFEERKNPNEAIAKMASNFGNSRRYALNILDLKNADAVKLGVQQYEVGPMIRNQLLDFVAVERWGDCLNPGPEGRNFYLTFTPANESKTRRNSYKTEPDPEKKSVLELLPEGWVDQLDDLDGMVSETKSAESIQKLVDEAKVTLGLASNPAPKKAVPEKDPDPDPDEGTAAAEPPAPEEVDDADGGDASPEVDQDEVDDIEAKLNALGL